MVAAIFLTIQIVMVIYINLTQLKYHIGYDASSCYLQAVEIWKQKTLLLSNWDPQTTLSWDSPVPLAAILYGITKNIFLSYGIANIICSGLLITILYKIMKLMKFSLLASILCTNLFISPFIPVGFNNANHLGYFSMLFASMSAYSVRIFIVLLILYTFLLYSEKEETKNQKICTIISVLLSLISGISTGFYVLVTIMIPLLIYSFIRVLAKNNLKMLFNKQNFFIVIIVVFTALGKLISAKILGFNTRESGMVLIGLTDFWKNMGSIFLGFLGLFGALPMGSNTPIFSIPGISFLINLTIFIICSFGFIFTINKFKSNFNVDNNTSLILSIFIFNISVFIFSFTTYGAPIFEERYLIPAFILIIFIFGQFVDKLSSDLIFKKFIIIGMIVFLTASNIVSYKLYLSIKNDYSTMKEIVTVLDKVNAPVVFVTGKDLGIMARNLRVVDTTRVYKNTIDTKTVQHWGDYTYYDENSEYSGSTALLVTDVDYDSLPLYIKNRYKKVSSVGAYPIGIYRCDNNIIDLVSGIQKNINNDFMYTNGIAVANGDFDQNGDFITNGTQGFVAWGPYTQVKEEGKYTFILNYEVIGSKDDNIGFFDLAVNNGQEILAPAPIDKNKNKITLKGVELKNNISSLEYRVFVNKDVIIKLKSYDIIKEN
jgi:hypothetical protein